MDLDFALRENDEYIRQILIDAYADLRASRDPAVLYFSAHTDVSARGYSTKKPRCRPRNELV